LFRQLGPVWGEGMLHGVSSDGTPWGRVARFVRNWCSRCAMEGNSELPASLNALTVAARCALRASSLWLALRAQDRCMRFRLCAIEEPLMIEDGFVQHRWSQSGAGRCFRAAGLLAAFGG